MIVIDASVAVKWFVREALHEEALVYLSAPEALFAPDFLVLEVANVLRRKLKSAELTGQQVESATRAIPSFFEALIPASLMIERTMQLASTLDHPVYDCAYLACAIQHGTVMVTADGRFLRKAVASGFRDNIRALF